MRVDLHTLCVDVTRLKKSYTNYTFRWSLLGEDLPYKRKFLARPTNNYFVPHESTLIDLYRLR